ncbi:MAG: transposase, partial [Actinomycetota bacterium]|nr:transposase [Actinomycetota bacterium]
RPPKTSQAKPTLVLGADLNPDHLAWSLLKADGNPVSFGRIALDLSGSAEQNRDRLGVAVAALVEVARRHGAAIAVETLDFTRARAQLRSSSRRLKRLVSSFAYHKFFAVLSSRCAREDVAVISVNPAWSSVLGQANCAGVRGISVDQGAAAVLARRALGLRERVRPAVARRLPRSAADGHTQC